MKTRLGCVGMVRASLAGVAIILFAGFFAASAAASPEQEVYLNAGVLNGRAITLPNPVYPAVARTARVSGTLNVQVTVDELGSVISARAVGGPALLRASAVSAARKAKFSPTHFRGKAIKVKGVLVYQFELPGTARAVSSAEGVKLAATDTDAPQRTENRAVVGDPDGLESAPPAVSTNIGVVPPATHRSRRDTPTPVGPRPEGLSDPVSGGVLNGKAISLLKPRYSATARAAHAEGAVTVEIIVDEEGNVISAAAVSGPELLWTAAVEAAQGARFSPTKLGGWPVKVAGTLIYYFVAANQSAPDGSTVAWPDDSPVVSTLDPNEASISGGVLNGKAISLPKPDYPATARAAHASGAVYVQVIIDEAGYVIEANAVKGHLLLRAAAVAAARGARFSPTKLKGEPVKVSGTIIYNFVSDAPAESGTGLDANPNQDGPSPPVVSGGVLNGKAIYLPKPEHSTAHLEGVRGTVNVMVTVDEDGNVISAVAVSGPPLLRSSAVKAASGAKFSPTILNGTAVRVVGTLIYDFPSNAGVPQTVISGGILNGKAISLPKPIYPEAAYAARASGVVEVKITIDEEGNVIEAEAVVGHELLRAAAVDAARLAKFSPTKLSGNPVKVTGRIIYNFALPDDPPARVTIYDRRGARRILNT